MNTPLAFVFSSLCSGVCTYGMSSCASFGVARALFDCALIWACPDSCTLDSAVPTMT